MPSLMLVRMEVLMESRQTDRHKDRFALYISDVCFGSVARQGASISNIGTRVSVQPAKPALPIEH